MPSEKRSRIWQFFRGCFFFVFGLLAVLVSAFVFAWLLHNIFSEHPDEGFLRSLGPGTVFPLAHIIAGFVSCLVMGFTGAVWIRRSGISVVLRRFFRRR